MTPLAVLAERIAVSLRLRRAAFGALERACVHAPHLRILLDAALDPPNVVVKLRAFGRLLDLDAASHAASGLDAVYRRLALLVLAAADDLARLEGAPSPLPSGGPCHDA